MRAVWCFLVILSLVAPLGTAGITITPADAETELTAPRTSHETAPGARHVLDDSGALRVEPPFAPVTPPLDVGAPTPPPPPLIARLVDPTIRARAPPA